MRRRLKSESGQAMMQAVIGAVITGIVVITSIATINRQKQHGAETQVTMKSIEIQKRLQELIRNDVAWARTVANNASMSCFSTPPNFCNGAAGGAFNLHDEAAQFYPGTGGKTGFDPNGVPCAGFIAAPADGSATCPFRVTLTWAPVRPDTGAACNQVECSARITGVFEYNPKRGTVQSRSLNASTYSVTFTRDSKSRQDYFHVVYQVATNTAGGACLDTPTVNARPLNTVKSDTNSNVISIAGNQVTIKAGTYYCEVTAPVGPVQEHQATLHINGGTPTRIVGSSAYYLAPSIVSGRFTLAANNWFRIEHEVRGGAAQGANCFGTPANIAGVVETYAQVKCRRISQ